MLKKHLTIIKITWQRALTYRFTVLTYRIGEILEILALVLMWSAIFKDQEIIRGYTLPEMITYILVGNLVDVFVRNWLWDVVSRDIRRGTLSQFLVKPIDYFWFITTREIGRVMLAIVLSIVSQFVVILFFLNYFLFNTNLMVLALVFAMVLLAFVLELLLSYLIGLISFWTVETSGLHSTIWRLKKFFSGGYFPLSLLPVVFVQISFLLPFAYSFFVPAQLYLGKISLTAGLKGILVQIAWIFILYVVIRIVWKRGLKRYEGVGI